MNRKHPETFQGSLKKKNYFEGWYYKISSHPKTYSIIAGISLGSDSHSFIQLIEGGSHSTRYLRFPVDSFRCRPGTYDIRIGSSRFLPNRIDVNEVDGDFSFKADLSFSGLTPFNSGKRSPGIMGPYGSVPFMECYHGVVSACHRADGELSWNGSNVRVDGWEGYTEKDWGRSMPDAWIWIQSNSFEKKGTSFMLSSAIVPFLGRHMLGHLGFLYTVENYYTFATWNGSSCEITPAEGGNISIRCRRPGYVLEAFIPGGRPGGELIAPVKGSMKRTITERTDAEIHVTLSEDNGNQLFEGKGLCCGVETAGDINRLKSLRG